MFCKLRGNETWREVTADSSVVPVLFRASTPSRDVPSCYLVEAKGVTNSPHFLPPWVGVAFPEGMK